jgi:cellulose synthase (UDP-forming)
MEGAIRRFAADVAAAVRPFAARVADPGLRAALAGALAAQAARHVELTPYAFHVSEDIYTSVLLHADERRRWRSVHHPRVLTRMLSPPPGPSSGSSTRAGPSTSRCARTRCGCAG